MFVFVSFRSVSVFVFFFSVVFYFFVLFCFLVSSAFVPVSVAFVAHFLFGFVLFFVVCVCFFFSFSFSFSSDLLYVSGEWMRRARTGRYTDAALRCGAVCRPQGQIKSTL